MTHIPEITAAAEDKNYLIRNDVWDEDYWLCAANIARNIIDEADEGANTWDAMKHGRRSIMALCRVFAQKQIEALKSKPAGETG